jgi:hypothetical protein
MVREEVRLGTVRWNEPGFELARSRLRGNRYR